jgi:phosphoglucomutase
MMDGYCTNPPKTINGSRVIRISDYTKSVSIDLLTGKTQPIELPKSDVLQFLTEDGSNISVRPSGTEPKIKYYIGVKEPLSSAADYEKVNKELDSKIEQVAKDMVP